jgi:predicted HTH domain antitoxin
MNITVPDEALKGTSFDREHALLDLALGIYADSRATLGQAARIACMPQAQFMKELASRKIPLHYSVADFQQDMAVLERL